MLSEFLICAVFGFHLVLGADLLMTNDSDPMDLIVRLCAENGSLSILEIKALHNVEKNQRVLIEIRVVENFSHDTIWANLSTISGQEVRLYLANVTNFEWSFAVNAEVRASTPVDDVVSAIVRHFDRQITYSECAIYNEADTADHAAALFIGLAKSGIRLESISVDGDRPVRVTETELLQFIRKTGVTKVSILYAEPWSVSNAFFQDPTVQRVDALRLQYLEHNAITDETLLGLNATSVSLGNATDVTLIGLRGFFQPVFDGQLESRWLSLIATFDILWRRDLFTYSRMDFRLEIGREMKFLSTDPEKPTHIHISKVHWN